MTKMGFLRGVINTISTNISTLLTNLATVRTELTFQHQADAVISQANPVSTTLYPVLATTLNVRIIGISASVTWTGQPSPLEVVVTIDGQDFTFGKTNPVSATFYYACLDSGYTNALQALSATCYDFYRAFLLEGKSIAITARTTGGTVSNLKCRVKYAKR